MLRVYSYGKLFDNECYRSTDYYYTVLHEKIYYQNYDWHYMTHGAL